MSQALSDTTVERAAEVLEAARGTLIQGRVFHPAKVSLRQALQILADADLLAAPVDGELRDALAEKIRFHVFGDDTPRDEAECCVDALLPIIAAHVAEQKQVLREEIAAELARFPAEHYPADVFGHGLSTDDTRDIREALASIDVTLDRISAAVMRHAYKNAARIARGGEE